MAKRRAGRKARKKAVKLAHVSIIEVDNPMYSRDHSESVSNPRRIQVAYNPRESYVAYLFYSQKKINEAEKRAGDKVRKLFEAMGGAPGSINFMAEPVDGGGNVSDITQAQLDAGRELKRVSQLLGPQGHDLVLRVCGQNEWPREMSGDKEMQRFLSMRLRECLEVLAVHWGYRTRKIVGGKC